MFLSQLPKVLILAQNPEAGRRWADMLAQNTAATWLSAAEVPPGTRVDVLVTDLASLDEASRHSGLEFCQEPASGQPRAAVGVIAMRPVDWADLSLAANCTQRELCLACQLLSEIVRLRHGHDAMTRRQQETEQLAETDPLTGLANRRVWDRLLQIKSTAGQQASRPLWLAIVDLDGFKTVNDRCGLLVGDRVLQRAARALAEQLRREDVVARLGGDEFGVLLAGVSEEQARGAWDRLRAAVESQSVPPEICQLTASIGYALAGENGAAMAEVFAAAEDALREAKRGGGDRVCRGALAAG
jgi:diguanylate cyclase (GGDEF)-like protein